MISGDIRLKLAREGLKPFLREGERFFCNERLPDWEMAITPDRIELGPKAFESLVKFDADRGIDVASRLSIVSDKGRII